MVEKEQLITMVRGMQAGDEAATAQMYETFHEDFYYFILKTVNNDRELAEDLLQDTFLEILETIHKLEEPVAFVTWAKQIAYHKCTAYFRKKKDLLLDENEDGTTVLDIQVEENAEFIPDEALDNKELKQTIMDMINKLPEEQRAALLLRYFNEVSVQEIAQIQNVSEGTVKSRLNYARKSIKQAVENYEKKNGVKLRCVGILPLLLWLFREYRLANNLSMAVGTAGQTFELAEETAAVAGVAATGGAAAGAATTTAATTASTTATAVTAKSAAAVGIKAAATALTTKIVAGVAAAAIVIGGTAAGITGAKKQNAPKQPIPETAIMQAAEETEDAEDVMAEEVVLKETTAEETTPEKTAEETEATEESEEAAEPNEESAKETEVTEEPEAATEPAEEPEAATKPTEESEKATEPDEAPADAPEEPAGCEHQWDVDQVSEDGFVLYRCEICDAVKSEELTDAPVEEPADAPTEEPVNPDTCEHSWKCVGVAEGEEGVHIDECLDCGSMKYHLVCTSHPNCIKTEMTDPVDGSTYIQYTCYTCGAVFTSRD